MHKVTLTIRQTDGILCKLVLQKKKNKIRKIKNSIGTSYNIEKMTKSKDQ